MALLTAASLMRQEGAAAADSMWAEDGQVFYQQSVQFGFFQVLVRPYNGYLHVIPRLLMELVRVFPMADAAAATAVIGATATSAMALLVYVASGTLLQSRALRISVAAPLALTWVAQLELGNNILSLHIYLLYVAFWLCLWNPRHRAALVLAAALLVLTAASDPLVGIYLPLLVLRAWAPARAAPLDPAGRARRGARHPGRRRRLREGAGHPEPPDALRRGVGRARLQRQRRRARCSTVPPRASSPT